MWIVYGPLKRVKAHSRPSRHPLHGVKEDGRNRSMQQVDGRREFRPARDNGEQSERAFAVEDLSLFLGLKPAEERFPHAATIARRYTEIGSFPCNRLLEVSR